VSHPRSVHSPCTDVTGELSVRLSVNFYIFDFFSRTIWPILTILGTNHPWGEWIQVYSNEWRHPFLRGDNSEKLKINKKYLKISRTSGQIQSNLVQIILGQREFKFVHIKDQVLFKWEIIKKVKMGWGNLKIFSKTTGPEKLK
jgi:hypothetical protein